MSESPDSEDLTRYRPILETLADQGIEFVLAAGHAVNAWAQVFYDRIEGIESFLPFTSKDADLIAHRSEIFQIAKKLEGNLKIFRDLRSPVLGVFTTKDDPPLKFELLQGLFGMGHPDSILKRAKHFGSIPVIDPVMLLISKANNLGGLDQEGRQDQKHLILMSKVTQCYLEDLVNAVGEHISEREFIKELKLMIKLLKHPTPSRGLSAAQISILDCLPVSAIAASDHSKVKRFLSGTFGIFW